MAENSPTEQAILAQTQQNQLLLEKIYASAEKTRKMFMWTLILTIVTILLPMIGLIFAIPFFINNYVTPLTGKGLGL